MKILVTICARGGSESVKNKNIRKLNGIPLIAYTIDYALAWKKACKVVCSTDSIEIADVAKKYGALVPFRRPDELATDDAGKADVIRHALFESEKIFNEKYDIVVDLDVTSPIRESKDLEKCLEIFMRDKPELLFSVTKCRRNPYFNMVELNSQGYYELCKKSKSKILRRQDAPKVYDMNASIYFYNSEALRKGLMSNGLPSKSLVYVMDDYAACDIDHELDFQIVEFLISKRGEKSELSK